jgi:Holliday junction resolvase-like predicted endonuclease
MPRTDTGAPGSQAPRTTVRRRRGDAAERLARALLQEHGWEILATNVRVGRDELDIVAVEPPGGVTPDLRGLAVGAWTLVFVEVRSNGSGRFGPPEESVGRDKVMRVYRAAMALVRARSLPDGTALPLLSWRVDLLAVEDGPSLGAGIGGPTVRHLRDVRPE